MHIVFYKTSLQRFFFFFCMYQKACVIASSFYCVFLGVHVDTSMQQPTLVLDKKVVEPRFWAQFLPPLMGVGGSFCLIPSHQTTEGAAPVITWPPLLLLLRLLRAAAAPGRACG